ncbi:MAG: LysR family transcriptional regulator [Myxococcota bacterium]
MIDSNETLFLRVVEAGSLKAAAEQIRANPSAVSRRIAALESRLGVRLLVRSTKRSVPTEAGTAYYDGMRKLVDQQEALESRVAGTVDKPTGKLRVTAPVEFGARFVAPVLSALQDSAPDLRVELLLGSGFWNLVEQGIDVAIRIGQLPDSSLVARQLGVVPRVVVASSEYVATHGAPTSPDELSSHPFVFYRPEQANTQFRMRKEGVETSVTMSGSFTVNSVHAIHEWVSAGRGLHFGPTWMFQDGLADGSIIALCPDYELDAFPLRAVYLPTPYLPAKVRTFIERMANAVASNLSLRATQKGRRT